MVVTNNATWDKRARFLRDHGMDKKRRYYHPEIGYNYRITNIQAAIGLAQLAKLDHRFSLATPSMVVGKGTKLANYNGAPTIVIPFASSAGPFVVEAKFYRDLMMWGLLKGDTKTGICAFWNKLKTDLFLDGRHPMLIARQNQQSPYVLLDEFGIKFFSLRASAHYPPLGAHFVWFDNFIAEAAVPPQKLNFRSQP